MFNAFQRALPWMALLLASGSASLGCAQGSVDVVGQGVGGATATGAATASTSSGTTSAVTTATTGGGSEECGGVLTLCDGVCVSLTSDPHHCGSCDKTCSAGQFCVEGTCGVGCPSPLAICGSSCVDVVNDPLHCGSCDKACPIAPGMSAVCVAGACDSICQKNRGDCDGKADNGCETLLSGDVFNCGSCANKCAALPHATPGCTEGKCGIGACDPGYGDCDQQSSNGCETNLAYANAHCGACGNACAGGLACINGTCQSAPTSFSVLEKKDITYQGIDYLLLKVSFASFTAASENWCRDYTNLCLAHGYVPTGCGAQFNSGGYGECKSVYLSDGISNSLGCNASGGVASAAQQNGYADATGENSFAFHYCSASSCSKTMCSGTYCNSALSYIDANKPYGYTLCKK